MQQNCCRLNIEGKGSQLTKIHLNVCNVRVHSCEKFSNGSTYRVCTFFLCLAVILSRRCSYSSCHTLNKEFVSCIVTSRSGMGARMTRPIYSHTNLESVVAGEHEVAVRQDDHVLLPDPGYLQGIRLK